jgi:hypothetical protein
VCVYRKPVGEVQLLEEIPHPFSRSIKCIEINTYLSGNSEGAGIPRVTALQAAFR